jgi:hypothetical protein
VEKKACPTGELELNEVWYFLDLLQNRRERLWPCLFLRFLSRFVLMMAQ